MFPDSSPYVTYGQGDGTVNAVSLLGCDMWDNSKWKFDHRYLAKGEHMQILGNLQYIQYVKDVLRNAI